MKVVKQILMHIVKKTSDTCRALRFIYSSSRSCYVTVRRQSVSDKLRPSGVSDSRDTKNLQQRVHDTQKPLTQLCIDNSNHSNTLGYISVAQQHYIEFESFIISFWKYVFTCGPRLLRSNHSQDISSSKLSIAVRLASTTSLHFY